MSKHILYTVKEGDNFRYINFHKDTEKRFNKVKKTGILEIMVGDSVLPVPLSFMMLVDEVDNFDFILKKKR